MNKKGVIKISTLMIGLVFVSLFVSVFTLFIAEGTTKYSVTFNSSEFSSFDRFKNLTENTEDLKDDIEDLQTQTGLTDRIGAMFQAGYDAIKTTFASMTLTGDIMEEGLKKANLGETSKYFATAFGLIIVIAFIVMIVMRLILKGDV